MAKNKRNPTERNQHKKVIVQLLIDGWTQQQVADKLGLSRQQISFDLKTIQKEWKQNTALDLDGYKSLQLAKLDYLERRAWESFEKSCQKFNSVQIRDKTPGTEGNQEGSETEGQFEEMIVKFETRAGNPAYLDKVLSCIDKRCKLLGLYAPERIETEGVIVIDSAPARGVDEEKL